MDGGGAGAGAGASGGGKEASCDWRTREDWVTLRRVATRPRPPYLPANWRVSASGPPARRDHALCPPPGPGNPAACNCSDPRLQVHPWINMGIRRRSHLGRGREFEGERRTKNFSRGPHSGAADHQIQTLRLPLASSQAETRTSYE